MPVVHVTVNGLLTSYPDTHRILSTRGVDSAGCPYTGDRDDESEPWQQLTASSPGSCETLAGPTSGTISNLPRDDSACALGRTAVLRRPAPDDAGCTGRR
jgi:hypothetical protein